MEIDRPVVAPSGTQTSVSVALHPLIIMNISEQWTRSKAQNNGKAVQVYGALLGKQNGRNLELMNSFELRTDLIEGQVIVDKDYFRTREAQYKEVFPDLDFLGWYTTGDLPDQSDVAMHTQMCDLNESPVFVKMSPAAKQPNDKLPVHVYESVIDLVQGAACMQFVELTFSLATEEAERIGVDHVARISGAGPGSASSVTKHLFAHHGAVKMLHNRLRLLGEYVKAVQEGKLPRNEEVLREISGLCNRLPVMVGDRFKKEYNNCNDITLMAYLGVLTKTCGSMNGLINKLNVLQERHGGGAMRRGRGLMM